ncbi:hypothetical protein NIES4074_43910 [Cylindrospermum sp. NIES-4074]|nr:hypothetical protein NIES4074_43910 [Cylindrospermum sp. NIES-4074]
MTLINDLLQALNATLDGTNVNLVVAYPGNGADGPSYFDLTVTNGNYLNGLYDSYCIDIDVNIQPGNSYQATVYSSYNNSLPSGIVEKPQNLDQLNWLINQNFVGQSSGSYGAYTSGDVQVAIWQLLENPNNITQFDLNSVGSYDNNRVQQLLSLAQSNGVGFVPGISADGTPQDIGIILVPKNPDGGLAQTTINILKTAALGDFVWEDLNANGIQDGNEQGVQGVTVTLTGGGKDGVVGTADDTIVTTTTDANGAYLFPLLLPGVEYKVTFGNLPTGFVFTAPNQGNNITKDSNADPSTGATQIITLSPKEFNRTIDAGIYQLSSLSGFVYVDANNNGVKDAGEVAIAGATITLTGIDGLGQPVTFTASTAADGSYKFDNLRPGTYNLIETQPNGFIDGKDAVGSQGGTLSNDAFTTINLTSGANGQNYNFGELLPATIGDFVWEDKNKNGIQDTGESGIAGVSVTLTGAGSDGVIGTADDITVTTTTDAAGKYNFTGLTPDVPYQVTFNKPTGFNFTQQDALSNDAVDSDANFTTGKSQIITLASGENNTTIDAGLYKPASIGDFVWEDKNANGIQDAGDNGIAGVKVTLNGAGADGCFGTADDTSLTTTTDAGGKYSFTDLTPGIAYQVTFDKPTGFKFTKQNVGSNDAVDSDANTSTGKSQIVTLAYGENNTTIDAGLYKPASIGDFVWEDKNGNGIQDTGENGIACVDVTLKGAGADGCFGTGDDTSITTTTDAAGKYNFTGLTPGLFYQVAFEKPTGYKFTKQNAGSNDAIDSDANTSTGKSQIITLASGEHNTTIDAGLYKPASIGNFVWEDKNGNGTQDTGEYGIACVDVTLKGAGADGVFGTGDDTSVATSTDLVGKYSFTGLTPGVSYQVTFEKPTGYNFTKQNVGSNDAVDSDANTSTGKSQIITLASGEHNTTIDAGLYKPASIGDFVWNDSNKNGIQDYGEKGISGVTVKLLSGSGSLIATTTTNATGNYLFDNLTSGHYQVQFVTPVGYTFSPTNRGFSDAYDSDANTNGLSPVIALSYGASNRKIDAGLFQNSTSLPTPDDCTPSYGGNNYDDCKPSLLNLILG